MPGLRISTIVDKGNDTFKPMYQIDGTGRDLYVQRNNGGFAQSYYTPSKQNTRGMSMYVGRDQRGGRQDIYPSILGKTTNYNYNGTGRDTYIAESNGGFYPNKQIAEYVSNFKDQLRVSHFVQREGTAEYMARRNNRINAFARNKKSIDDVGNDHSPEGSVKRRNLIHKIIQGGSSSPTDIYKRNNGWVINQ